MQIYFLNDDFCSWALWMSMKVYCTHHLPSNTRTHSGWLNLHPELRHLCSQQQHLAAHMSVTGNICPGQCRNQGRPKCCCITLLNPHPSTADYCWECSMTAALVGGSYRRIMSPSSSQSVSVVQNWHSEVPLPLSWGLNHRKNHMFPEKSAFSFLFIRYELSARVSASAASHRAQQIK